MLDDILLGDLIHQRHQLYEEVTALAAAGTLGKVVEDIWHQWLVNHTQMHAGSDTWLVNMRNNDPGTHTTVI
jgi:hypothetical protein